MSAAQRPRSQPSTTFASAGRGVSAMGPRDAPSIVFLHSTRLTRAAWLPQLTDLADEFRTIALDLPGHGDRSSETFTLDGAAATVGDFIRSEAGGSAVVVGLSLGGYVAMALAASQPEVVRGLIIAGASAEPVGVRALPYRALALAFSRLMTSRPQRLSTLFFRTRYGPEIAEPIVAGGFWPRGGAEALHALVGERFAQRLHDYAGPVLILNGQFDVLFRASARAFTAGRPDIRNRRLAGALHLSNLDRPAAFSLAVREFARSLGPA